MGATNYPRGVRFLLSRRWVLFFLVVVVLAWLATQLGQWQFHRLDERKHDNHIVAHQPEAAAQPRRRRPVHAEGAESRTTSGAG